MLAARRFCRLFSSAKLRDYYRILGVAPSASDKQIKAQFHRLAKQYHPDSGKHKDQKKFKELLEAYKYLSDPANPRTESSTTSSGSQQQSNTHEEQEAYQKETREQRIRRETYEYFNRTRRPREQKEESNSGYDSFLETIKAAPELILMTVFVGVVIAQWIWMMPKQPRPYSVEERVFQTKEDEEEYYRRQLMKESQRAHMFDWKSKFDGHRPKNN